MAIYEDVKIIGSKRVTLWRRMIDNVHAIYIGEYAFNNYNFEFYDQKALTPLYRTDYIYKSKKEAIDAAEKYLSELDELLGIN